MKKQLFVGLAVAVVVSVASAAEITKDWKIVYPDRAVGADLGTESGLGRLAREIAEDFEEATGFKPPVVRQSQATAETRGLWLGASAAKAAGFAFGDWTRMKNAYAATNGNVYCFGNDRQGSKSMQWSEVHRVLLPSGRAAMRFMRDVVGALYVMPGRAGTVVPRRERIELVDGTFSAEDPQVFFGSSRGSLSYSYANADFPRGTFHDYGGHSFPAAVPKELFKEHPDYFAMNREGKRFVIPGKHSTPLCISHPDVQERVFLEAKKHFDDGADICQVAQDDGDVRCFCPKCRELYGTGDDWGEKLWIFFRRILERLERECPGKTACLLAYGVTARPPKTFRAFPKNTMIQVCSYDEATLREWTHVEVPQGLSAYLYLWGDYQDVGHTPRRSFAGLAELVNRLFRYNVRGIYRCGGSGEMPGIEGPQYYYFNRLLENPKAGISETLKEFCDAAFGPEAGEPMFRFYEAIDVRLRVHDRMGMGHWEAESPDISAWSKADAQSRRLDLLAYIYTADVVSTLDGCLAHAKRCKMTDRERTRLKRVEVEWSYARNLGRIANLYNGYRTAPSYERLEPLLKEIDWRNAFIERVYAPRPKGAKTPDWLWTPLFAGRPREYIFRNSRLAPIYEPLDWDVATMRRDRVAPGAPGEVERWKKYNREKGLRPLKGWRAYTPQSGDLLEVRPDGTGFVMVPSDIKRGMRVYSAAKDEARRLKPNTRYRLSWFAKLEDVRVWHRYAEYGFYGSVSFGKKYEEYLMEPAGGKGLVGSSGWRHMSTTFRTTDAPDFTTTIYFRMLTSLGRVEVEEVTLEELE